MEVIHFLSLIERLIRFSNKRFLFRSAPKWQEIIPSWNVTQFLLESDGILGRLSLLRQIVFFHSGMK